MWILDVVFDFNIKMWKINFVPFFEAKVGGATYTQINTVISYFNLKFPLPALFCSNVVYKYTCSCDKNTSYIGMTTRQLFV